MISPNLCVGWGRCLFFTSLNTTYDEVTYNEINYVRIFLLIVLFFVFKIIINFKNKVVCFKKY